MRKQVISWLCLIMCAQAMAFITCQNTTSKATGSEVLAMDSISRELSTDMSFNDHKPIAAKGDQQQTNTRGAEEVVHERRGAYGGADLYKKPTKTKSGARSLPVALGYITLRVCVVLSYFFLLP